MPSIKKIRALRRIHLSLLYPSHEKYGYAERFEPEQLLYMARVAQLITDAFKPISKKRKNIDENRLEVDKARAQKLLRGETVQIGKDWVQSLEMDCATFGFNSKPLVELIKDCEGMKWSIFKNCLIKVNKYAE